MYTKDTKECDFWSYDTQKKLVMITFGRLWSPGNIAHKKGYIKNIEFNGLLIRKNSKLILIRMRSHLFIFNKYNRSSSVMIKWFLVYIIKLYTKIIHTRILFINWLSKITWCSINATSLCYAVMQTNYWPRFNKIT